MAKIKLWYVYDSTSLGLTGGTISVEETIVQSTKARDILAMIEQAKPQHGKIKAWFPYQDTFNLWCKHKGTMKMDDFKQWRVQVFNTIHNPDAAAPVTTHSPEPAPARRVRVPSLPVEVWNDAPIDGAKAMDALRVLCGGNAKGE